jgi:hypothetical protein
MWRGKDRADWFTGRMSALLTKHWLERSGFYIGIFTIPKAFNTDPMLRASIPGIFLAHERDVIFHGTGCNTSLAPRANILINGHPPLTFRRFCNGAFRADHI